VRVIEIREAGQLQSLHGLDRRPHLERLLRVRLRLRVSLTVVVPGVDVSPLAGKVVVHRHAIVGRSQKPFALTEDRSLEAIAIRRFGEVQIRRLLGAEADPRALGGPLIEIELAIRVFQPERLRTGQRAAVATLARNVRRNAERDQRRDGAGHIEVRARDLERRRADAIGGVRIVAEDRATEFDDHGVIGDGHRGRESTDQKTEGAHSFLLCVNRRIVLGIRVSGRTYSTAPRAMASFGIPKITHVASSWAIVCAPASRISARPAAPSSPMPVRITPTALAPATCATERKSTSTLGRWRETSSPPMVWTESRPPWRRNSRCSLPGAMRTRPGRTASPVTASFTSTDAVASSRFANAAVKPSGMCCTTSTGGALRGSDSMMIRSASVP